MSVSRTPLDEKRPFPGLRPFYFEDHKYFFGREEQAYALYLLVERYQFVAVVGGSGSGKSSLVRAGLKPLFGMNDGAWLQTDMTPGKAPLRRLTEALAGLAKDDDDDVASARHDRIAFYLRSSSHGIEDALGEIGLTEDASLLLVVDQFEELFRYASSDPRRSRYADAQSSDEATRFVKLLLQASEARNGNIHVLLTMRSDFIGDCARFQGLPEAVSAAPFLVPSLTRDQLKEAICGPITRAKATIESGLVNVLLNEGNEDDDRLPVLQHCLSRLWERVGTIGRRHLTRDDYQIVGGLAEALSRHADDILRDPEVPESVVEPMFRALAEVDKNGRAIRRPRTLQELHDETRVSKDALILAIDRLREDGCSFLTTSVQDDTTIKNDTVKDNTIIDVGHEALLRRWTRVSGVPDAPLGDSSQAVKARGWLAVEQNDGKQYRDLINRIDDFWLPIRKLYRLWRWWPSRTPAWTERYGGRFAEVDALFRRSLVSLSIVGTALALAVFLFVQMQIETAKQQHAYQTVLREIAQSVFGAIESEAIPSSSSFAKQITNKIQASLNSIKGAGPSADPDWNYLVYLSTYWAGRTVIRVDKDKGIEEFRKAQAIIQQLVGHYSDVEYRSQDIFIQNEIGDGFLWGDNYDDALREFDKALELGERHRSKHPDALIFPLRIAQTHSRTGQVLKEIAQTRKAPEKFDEARDRFSKAIAILQDIASKPTDQVILKESQSTLANTYRLNADTLLLRIDPQQHIADAKSSYEAAIRIYKTLAAGDPGDQRWNTLLPAAYEAFGRVLERENDIPGALTQYQPSLDIRRFLALSDPTNPARQRQLKQLEQKVAELRAKLPPPPEVTGSVPPP